MPSKYQADTQDKPHFKLRQNNKNEKKCISNNNVALFIILFSIIIEMRNMTENIFTRTASFSKASSRLTFLDIAKGITIILMIIGHCHYVIAEQHFLECSINGFHMPMFFIIAGITTWISESKSQTPIPFLQIVKKKALALLVPYFIAGFISILMLAASNASYYIATLFFGFAGEMEFNFPLWFLPALFLSDLIFSVLIRLCHKEPKAMLFMWSIAFTIIGYYFVKVNHLLPWNLDIALFSQVFLCVGFLSAPFLVKFAAKNHSVKQILIVCSIFAAVLTVYLLTVTHNTVNLNGRSLGNVPLFFLDAFLGSFATLILSILLSKIKYLSNAISFIGKHSLDILCWHMPIITIFYVYIVPKFSGFIQECLFGWHDKWLAAIILLTVAISLSLLIHWLVFSRKIKNPLQQPNKMSA